MTLASARNISGASQIGAQKPTRSYLKWAGSKTRLISQIAVHIPRNAKRFLEPFGGSGVVALNLAPRFESVLLADANRDLIDCHKAVVRQKGFVTAVSELFTAENNSQAAFTRLREEFNATKDRKRKAALFLYLNRHCFNGLCRYSAAGQFNSPFGRPAKPYLPETEMASFAERLSEAAIEVTDFRSVLAAAKKGDFVYCDPPYAPLSTTANFSAYSAGGFSADDHQDLANLAFEASRRGACVAVSNHDTSFTRQLYHAADGITELMVARTISCDGASRQKVSELIAVYRPHRGGRPCQ